MSKGRKPPIAFQGRDAAMAALMIDGISKALAIDLVVQLLHVIHGSDESVDLGNHNELAGLILSYAMPIAAARGDGFHFPSFDFSPGPASDRTEIMESIDSWEVPDY